MRIASLLTFPVLAGSALLALATGCKKETDPRVHPDLAFKTGAGYVAADDTVPQQDTLKIGAIIDKTEDPLISLNVSRAYDGGGSSTIEDISLTGQEHVEHDVRIITRAQAGTEKYSFAVLDRDGNVTLKSITLTVQ